MNSKRIFGIFLAAALTVPMALTGCNKQEDDIDTEYSIRQNVTLNMYILTEKETDPEQALAVQTAINEYLVSDYKTVIKLNYLTEDDYWPAIEDMETKSQEYAAEVARLEQEKIERAKSIATGELVEEEVDEEELAEQIEEESEELINSVYEGDDIVLEHDQIDLFVVDNAETYNRLIKDGRIIPIDTYITSENKELKKYVYPTFFEGASLGGAARTAYGVPTNKAIGEYEYFVFDKELLEKYNFDAKKLNTFEALGEYLAVILANEPEVVPLANAATPLAYEYFEKDGSVLGVDYKQYLRSTFENDTVKEHFAKIREYRNAGYLREAYNEGTRFAVDVRKGYAYSPEEWGDKYECVVYKSPVATNENILNGVFVVSSYSRNPSRAVEMIKLFNTDATLANLLQYGLVDTHYYMNAEGDKIQIKAGSGYAMNNNYTGNNYIKYTVEGSENHFEADKRQNSDSVISLYFGFVPKLTAEEKLVYDKAQKVGERYYEGLMRGSYDTATVFDTIAEELKAISVSDEEIEEFKASNPEYAETVIVTDADEETEEAEETEETEETEEAQEEVKAARETNDVTGDTQYDKFVASVSGQFDEYYEIIAAGTQQGQKLKINEMKNGYDYFAVEKELDDDLLEFGYDD